MNAKQFVLTCCRSLCSIFRLRSIVRHASERKSNTERLAHDLTCGTDRGEKGSFKFDPASRYYDAGGIEVQEIIRAKLTPEQYQGFCLGNIIKYSCRANFKGSFERDVEKVKFYHMFLSETVKIS